MAHGRPDFSPTAADVVLRSEWHTIEGHEKTLVLVDPILASRAGTTLSYVVPAGKTLYINKYTFQECSSFAADADERQQIFVAVTRGLGGDVVLSWGGDGGGAISLSQPDRFDAGETVFMILFNMSGHTADVDFLAGGYEI